MEYSREHEKTLDIILNQTQQKLTSQEEEWSSLRTKIGILLAAAALVLPNVMRLRGDLPAIAAYVLIPVFIPLMASILYCLYALFPRRLRNDPDPRRLAENYLDEPPRVVKAQVLANLIESHDHNREVIGRAFGHLKWAFRSLTLAVIFFFVLVVLAWGGRWNEVAKSSKTSIESAPPSGQRMQTERQSSGLHSLPQIHDSTAGETDTLPKSDGGATRDSSRAD